MDRVGYHGISGGFGLESVCMCLNEETGGLLWCLFVQLLLVSWVL